MDDVLDHDKEDLWLEMPFSVGDADVNDLALTLQPATPVTGRIVLENGDAAPRPSGRPIRILLARSAERYSSDDRGLQPLPDGSISARIRPGRYRPIADIRGTGYALKTTLVNGVDIGDGPLVVGAEPLANVEFVLARSATILRGTLLDAAGQPVPQARVAVFPADRQRWFRINDSNRGDVLEATAGRYEFTWLPEGEYYVVATETARGPLTPNVLDSLVADATRIVLRNGQPVTLNLVVRSDE
jgi:hypothetical protein